MILKFKKFEHQIAPQNNPHPIDNYKVMEDQWTTVSKRNNKAPAKPRQEHSVAYVEEVRNTKVYAKREFPAGVVTQKPLEPIVVKGSVFSSRLRQEVEEARVPLPAEEMRSMTQFQSAKPSPYKNAALSAINKEKLRIANAAMASVGAGEGVDSILNALPVWSRPKPKEPMQDRYNFIPDDEGFDDRDDIVKTRRTRVQPTAEFQTIKRVSHVTTIHKSAIDIIEPEDDEAPVTGHDPADYE